MRKLILLLLFFLFLLGKPSSIQAQNTFTCFWTGSSCIVDVLSTECIIGGEGSPEQNYCVSQTEETCNDAAGYCNSCASPAVCQPSSCSDGFEPASGTCTNPSDACCIEAEVDQTFDVCYRCYVDFGTPTCASIPANGDGGCGPNWSDLNVCTTECEEADSFSSFTCDTSGSIECLPAANGEYATIGDCVAVCNPMTDEAPYNLFCNTNGEATSVPQPRIYTGVGCIPLDSTTSFAMFFLTWGLGMIGGIALLMISLSAILLITSGGNPDKVKNAKDILTSAIAGLLLAIGSAYILRLIGVDILNLPGFGV